MKNDDLMDLIGKVDDKYIAELYEADADAQAPETKHGGVWKKWAALAACLALIIAGGAVCLQRGSSSAEPAPTAPSSPTPVPASAMTSVIMDVNPSIEFKLTPDGTVDSVTPLNSDAEKLLAELNLDGDGCAEVFASVVSELRDHGYITNMQNSLLLTVIGKDSEETEQVRSKVSSAMEYACSNCGYDVSILSQVADSESYAAEAGKYDISVGKAALIGKIVSGTDNYDYGELAKMNIHALDQIMDYIGTSGVNRVGKVAGALTSKVSGELKIDQLKPEEALDLAVALSDAYDELCEKNPLIDSATYTGYHFSLDEGVSDDGTKTWTITAQNTEDSSLPAISVKVGKNLGIITDDVHKYGKKIVSDSFQLARDIFGLPDLLK